MDTCAQNTGKTTICEDSSPREARSREHSTVFVHLDDCNRWTATLVDGDEPTWIGGSYKTVSRTRQEARLAFGVETLVLVRGPLALAFPWSEPQRQDQQDERNVANPLQSLRAEQVDSSDASTATSDAPVTS